MLLGANFMVNPMLNPEVAWFCNRRNVADFHGCRSVSEISTAEELRVEIVKIFPGSQVGGSGFVKSGRYPMPRALIMPTGGVSPDEENMQAWSKTRVACVGMGRKLVRKDLVANEDYRSNRTLGEDTLAWIRKIRDRHLIKILTVKE
jgi:2-dehydro-3-deoxyphosphogluconate aldolase/(4S)-4-hydroxy-2-oxoglutarate aldolase